MDLRPGVMVGDHARLVRPLGEGGMGTVWVAHHARLDVEVALKVIADPQLRTDPDLMERLRREARAAARISSPHVVHIYDQGMLPDGSPFVLMELLKGESLAERIEREHVIAFDVAADIVRQAVDALTAAHELSIVHRDIKPDNLYLCGDPSRPFVKVLDFGIALRHGMDNPDPRLTTTDRLVGTPAYMSPEMLLSTEPPGPQVDFWALAVTAYEMLTGALPHAGETLARLMMSVTSGDHIPVRQSRPALPNEVDIWFARSLALDAQDRFASGRELSDAFTKVCKQAAEAMAHVTDEFEATVPADSPLLDGILSSDNTIPHPHVIPGLTHATSANTADVLTRTVATSPTLTPATMGGASRPVPPKVKPRRGPGAFIALTGVALLLAGGTGLAIWKLSGDETPKEATSAAPERNRKPAPSEKKAPPKPPAGMIAIPAGTYRVGCNEGDLPRCVDDEGPAHDESVVAFAIMELEVTRAEYASCVTNKACPAMLTTTQCSGSADEPARCLTWDAADAYCKFRKARLPTEVEWEVAARGADAARHPWGDAAPTCELAIMKSAAGTGCGDTKPKAGGHEKDVSPFKIRNMAGNVREWTSTPYGAYPGGKTRAYSTGNMINRGGSYLMSALVLGASHTRIPDERGANRPDLGVRCAADLTD